MDDCDCPNGSHTLKGWNVSFGEEMNEDLLPAQILKIPQSFPEEKKPIPLEISTKTEPETQKPTIKGILPNLGSQVPSGEEKVKRNTSGNLKINAPQQGQPVIVIDGPSVATRHGKNQAFSTLGLNIAISHFEKKGYDVVAFVPEYYFQRKPPKPSEKMVRLISANYCIFGLI